MATKEPAKQPHIKVSPKPSGKMIITRDFLAAIGFERESAGARPYKPDNVEIWSHLQFSMPVAFYNEPPKSFSKKIELAHWPDIEKMPITDFILDLLRWQESYLTEDL